MDVSGEQQVSIGIFYVLAFGQAIKCQIIKIFSYLAPRLQGIKQKNDLFIPESQCHFFRLMPLA